MALTVLCVGKLKEQWQREACAEYVKRLSRYGGAEVVELPDQPEPQNASDATRRQILEKEGAGLLARIKPTDFVVALAIQGQMMDSETFSKKMSDWQNSGKRVVLVIGGSLGLSQDVQARADVQLSFSKLTFPHTLMRVILLEQLYRAAKIAAGERYHK